MATFFGIILLDAKYTVADPTTSLLKDCFTTADALNPIHDKTKDDCELALHLSVNGTGSESLHNTHGSKTVSTFVICALGFFDPEPVA